MKAKRLNQTIATYHDWRMMRVHFEPASNSLSGCNVSASGLVDR